MRLTPRQQEIAEALGVALRRFERYRDGPALVWQLPGAGDAKHVDDRVCTFRPDLMAAYVRDEEIAAALHAIPHVRVYYAGPPLPDPKKAPRKKRRHRPRRAGEVRVDWLAPIPAYKRPEGVLFA